MLYVLPASAHPHVAQAVGHGDAGRQFRMRAVLVQVVNGEIRPITLREPEEPTRLVHFDFFVRVEPRCSVAQVRRRPRICRVRNIDHYDTGIGLARVIFRGHIGAVLEVHWPIL